jgi:chromosome segregation ATPase
MNPEIQKLLILLNELQQKISSFEEQLSDERRARLNTERELTEALERLDAVKQPLYGVCW